LSSVSSLCTMLRSYKRVVHGEYMPTKVYGRLIGLVLSSCRLPVSPCANMDEDHAQVVSLGCAVLVATYRGL
jgi:hypothetical protein